MKSLKTLTSVFALTSLLQVQAQFDFSTGSEAYLEITQAYETVEVHCVPNPIDDMIINWDLIEMDPDLPAGWSYTICDQICYPFFTNHGNEISYTASQFTSGQEYKLKLGVSVNGIEGSGYVKYLIYDFNNPTYRDTVTFHLNYQLNGLEDHSKAKNKITYSISSGKLNIVSESIKEQEIEILSMDGTRIFQTKFQNQISIDQSFPTGIYYLIVNQSEVHKLVIFN
jgi:hypothetical protein